MDILKNIQTALIIDDNGSEITALEDMLNVRGIYTSYYTPTEITTTEEMHVKNHQLIFMDYSLDDAFTTPASNITLMRNCLTKICRDGFGAYGLVIWTKHPEEIGEIQERLSKDAETGRYVTPMFVICMDKIKYLEDKFDSLMNDLNDELLKNKAAAFFFAWRQSVERGADKVLKDVYALVPDYKKQERDFCVMLSKLALTYSGAPKKEEAYGDMTLDACKALNELMHYDVTISQRDIIDVFGTEKLPQGQWNEVERAIINGKFLIDDSGYGNASIMPGKVYKVKQDISLLKIPEVPGESEVIAIEVTPPCDWSQKKKVASRLIGGVLVVCPEEAEKRKEINKFFNFDCYYKVYPICIRGKICYLCFDFRRIYGISDEELVNPDNFEYLFTAKSRFFADILQKFSSHAARLGLAVAE